MHKAPVTPIPHHRNSMLLPRARTDREEDDYGKMKSTVDYGNGRFLFLFFFAAQCPREIGCPCPHSIRTTSETPTGPL